MKNALTAFAALALLIGSGRIADELAPRVPLHEMRIAVEAVADWLAR